MSRSVRLCVHAWPALAASAALVTGIAGATSTASRPPERIYAASCAYCHGHDVGPIIRGRQLPPALVEYMVRNGSGAMPAFRPTEITPTELTALAEWVSKSAADPKEHGR